MNKIKLIVIQIGVVAVPFTLMLLLNIHTYAWHENLGIDANKAAELYQTKPNDPAIVQWKNALQLAINDMGKCFDSKPAISCQSLMATLISNCNSHPDELLACHDSRIVQYPSILKNARVAETKTQKENAETYGLHIINKCIVESPSFEPARELCDSDVDSILQTCNWASPPYDYCKDERFVAYLKEHNIIVNSNSTVSPYSNLTGNSSSNSTYP